MKRFPSILIASIALAQLQLSAVSAAAFQPVISVDALLTYDSSSSPSAAQIFLRADGYPTPAHFQWTKDGRPLANGNRDIYDTSLVPFSAAGYYRLTVEADKQRVTSKPVPVGVVRNATFHPAPIPEGRAFSFSQKASGPELKYQWYKDGSPLYDDAPRIRGTQSPTLRISPLQGADEGSYHCIVTLGQLSLFGDSFILTIVRKPVITDVKGLINWAVGRTVAAQVDAQNHPTRFEARGLPPGVTFNPKTGSFGGRPTSAGTFHLMIRASNAAGTSDWMKFYVEIAPFPKEATGTFAGLVGRTGGHDPGYGGAWKFTVTPSGAFTGTVDVGTKRYPFSGRLENPLSGLPEAWIQLAQGWLVMNVKVDPIQQRADGSVSLSDFSFTLPLEAKKVLPLRPHVTPVNWQGLHYVKLSPDASVLGNPIYPQEQSIGQVTIRHNGSYTWAGRLSDGAAYTMSGQVTPLGAFAARTLLYGTRGSIQGWQELLEPEGRISGFLEWIKYHRTGDATFPNGFPLHSLDVREPGVSP